MKSIWCMGGSSGGQGVRTPLFGPRCRLFKIGPKIGPPPGSPVFSLYTYNGPPPPFKKSWIRPCGVSQSYISWGCNKIFRCHLSLENKNSLLALGVMYGFLGAR